MEKKKKHRETFPFKINGFVRMICTAVYLYKVLNQWHNQLENNSYFTSIKIIKNAFTKVNWSNVQNALDHTPYTEHSTLDTLHMNMKKYLQLFVGFFFSSFVYYYYKD